MKPLGFILTYLCLILAMIISNNSHSSELSAIVGLHVDHYAKSYYAALNEPPEDTGTQNEKGQWIYKYKNKQYNQGILNNQLIGIRYTSQNYSLALITYKNSFYNRSYGLSLSKTFRFDSLILETGGIVLTGYKVKLLTQNPDDTDQEKPVLAPVLSLAYPINNSINITYTSMSVLVGMLGMEFKF